MERSKYPRTVLVVEDEPAIAEVCRRVLTGDMAVDIAQNGKVAQEMVGKKPYVLCLIDIRTPAMNGIELYEWLRKKHPELADRVIFTSGDVMAENTQRFLKENAQLFLPKPFRPEELRRMVDAFFQREQPSNQNQLNA